VEYVSALQASLGELKINALHYYESRVALLYTIKANFARTLDAEREQLNQTLNAFRSQTDELLADLRAMPSVNAVHNKFGRNPRDVTRLALEPAKNYNGLIQDADHSLPDRSVISLVVTKQHRVFEPELKVTYVSPTTNELKVLNLETKNVRSFSLRHLP
jgi:hypothetical protein